MKFMNFDLLLDLTKDGIILSIKWDLKSRVKICCKVKKSVQNIALCSSWGISQFVFPDWSCKWACLVLVSSFVCLAADFLYFVLRCDIVSAFLLLVPGLCMYPNKYGNTTCFTTNAMLLCIIKVVPIVNPSEINVTLIWTSYINKREKLYP